MSDWCSCNPLKEAQEKAAKWDAIVRCGECEHCLEDSHTEATLFCARPGCLTPTHRRGFCAWGERKEQ